MTRPAVPSRLGIGPVSRNVVDAAIRLAYRRRRRVMLILSRSQVECRELGGGYVEGWSTDRLVSYISRRDPAGLLMICRDHGGPWQHPRELAHMTAEVDAMRSSLTSLRSDIRCGLSLLHLDTSREAGGPAPFDAAIRRLLVLYGECCELARRLGRRVGFEVGLERQGPDLDDVEDFEAKLECILASLRAAGLPAPVFVVGQTGTMVVGMENRGALLEAPRAGGDGVRALATRCWQRGIALKAHNVDYLPTAVVGRLVACGADAINVAPELGVAESTAFVTAAARLGLRRERDAFMRLAYDSGAWRKWFDSCAATDDQRSLAAGHYVFSTDEFRALKRQVDAVSRRRHGRTVDELLGAALDRVLERYATAVWDNERWCADERADCSSISWTASAKRLPVTTRLISRPRSSWPSTGDGNAGWSRRAARSVSR
jgi:hypothetical protein